MSSLENHRRLTPSALMLTSHLLRHDNPSLSLTVQRALDQLGTLGRADPAQLPEGELNASLLHALRAETVSQVLAALTAQGQSALAHPSNRSSQLPLLHQLLDDWVALAEWIISTDADADQPPGPIGQAPGRGPWKN